MTDSSPSLKLSLLVTGVPREHSSPAELCAATLELTRVARDSGFASMVIGQHLVSGPFQYLQPIPLLSRMIPESGTMNLVTGILLLPLFNPVDVAEQVASLDVMSGGRVIMGVGLGYRDEEFVAFGIDRSRRVKRMQESIQVIRQLWTGEPLRFSGTEFEFDLPPASIMPVRPGGPPIWVAAMAEKSLRRVIADGLVPFFGPRIPLSTLHGWREEEGLLKGASGFPLRRELFVGTGSSTQVWEQALEHIGARYEVYRSWGFEKDLESSSEQESLEDYLRQRAIIGTPDECIEQLEACRDAGANEIIVRCAWPSLPWGEVENMVRLAGDHFVPHFS